MEVALIECSDEKMGEEFQKEVIKQAKTVNFKYKKTKDLFNVLALSKKMAEDADYIVIIAQLSDKKEVNSAFYEGIATLQASTGKEIFKLLTEPEEAADIIEFANEFLDQVFGRKRAKEKEEDFI